jgi:MFS family permease
MQLERVRDERWSELLGPRRRLAAQGLLIAAVVGLAKADAAAVGVVAPALRDHLHLTATQIGLMGSLASATGAVCALPAGFLVDRRQRVMVLVVALIGWSLALGAAGFATGVALLAVARTVSGGVATIARPVSVSLTGDLFQPEDRGKALATLDTGQAIGTAVCFLLGSLAVKLLDWRWLFWLLGAGGVVLALLTSKLEDPVPVRASGPPIHKVLWSLLRIRTNLVVLVSDSVGNFFFAGAASFSVLFVSARYGLSNATVDALAPIVAVGVIVGILAGGRLGDRLARRGGGNRRITVAVVCQLAGAGIFAMGLLTGSVIAAGGLLILGATSLGGAGPCLDAVRVDIVEPSMRGRAEAARGLLTLASSALGPITFGLVATAFGGRGDGLALRDAFLVMLLPLAAGALILLAGMSPYRADAANVGTRPTAGMLGE